MIKPDDMENPTPNTQIKLSEETKFLAELIKEMQSRNENMAKDLKDIKKTMAQDISDIKKTLEEHK